MKPATIAADRRHYVAACYGKQRYETYRAADVVRRRRKMKHKDGAEQGIYKCRHCHQFHLGGREDE